MFVRKMNTYKNKMHFVVVIYVH